MSAESLEDRTVEVLGLPATVTEELLFLYFENKRRSGGGPLVSVEKRADLAVLMFEEAEAAAQVLSKEHHVVHNVELTVRKPASKDHCKLLLRGINPSTSIEMIELYVENMMGLKMPDYTLYPLTGRDVILIQLSQPFTEDFQKFSATISKRKLDGAEVTLEQVEQTDSVLVEKLHPGTNPELLTLYFESKRGGNQEVKVVTMLSEDTAKVSFVNYESVCLVLDQPHKLNGADLVVIPYFDVLQPTKRLMSQDSGVESKDKTDRHSQDIQTQTSLPDEGSSSQMAFTSNPEEAAEVYIYIDIADPVKLSLFQLSTFQKDTEKGHPNITIQIKDSGVVIAGSDEQKVVQIERAITDCFDQMSETNFTLETEMAQLLARKDVKEHLQQTLKQTGSPAMYTVSDCNVVVTSVSQNAANQACSFLKSQPCRFSISVDTEYESMLYCKEWTAFLQTLGLSFVKVSEQGGNIDVFTLKGMESEKQASIMGFLSTPIEREIAISMEPGMLKYIQIHCHQLLADMDQVFIFPLEAEDVCGLKIHGYAAACQMAEEVLQSIVSSICTRTITVNAPGVSRFLDEKECRSILKEMETKFQVYISTKHVPWEPLPLQQDIFEMAWSMMSERNFQKVSLDDCPQQLEHDSIQTYHHKPPNQGLLEEAMGIVSAADDRHEKGVTVMTALYDLDDMNDLDLYTADWPTSLMEQDFSVMVVDDSQLSAESDANSEVRQLNDGALDFCSNLEEDAQLSLAIQYSMESSHRSLEENEEEQLQKALELSKEMTQHEACSRSSEKSPKERDKGVSLEEAIKAANTAQLLVFAGYSCDLIRVDIAFGKKVSQRQVEEKVEHSSVKNINEYHRKCLDVIKRKHAVEIQVQGTIITVSGFKDFVAGGLCDVKLLLEKISNSITDDEITRTVQWSYHNPASLDATPYSPDATIFIENALRLRLKKVDVMLDNQPHIINLEKMQEHNIASGTTVKIFRKVLETGGFGEHVPEEEFSLLSNLPEVTRVDEESDEFQSVVKSFYETIQEYHSKIRIIQVEKLMNRLLYNQYKLKKASILQRAVYPEVERTLYHGTSEASVREICVHGFNRSFCGKNATLYGQGVYFAVNSALSVQEQYSPPNADGYKFIFVSKVLTGDYTKGCHSMKTAPLKETGDIPLRYDSVTDDITKPAMFVIFNDTQAFPEYLITCQRIHR